MIKILLVEDDTALNRLLTSQLKKFGYEVYSTENGLDALNIFYEKHVDVILSDIMMPLCDGFELAKNIRKENQTIPILFMSARDDKPSKQIGYTAGIDDYITKPFDVEELNFKIKAIARRLDIQQTKEISIKNLYMNQESYTVFIDQEEVAFSVKEFDILFHLLSNPQKTFTRSQLMEKFWDFDSSATSRTVDVFLSRLREKTKNCTGFEIQTIHGLGYKVVLK